MPQPFDPHRKKGLQEMMQELTNANLVKVISEGFQEIDRRADQAKKKLEAAGITGLDQIVDSFATIVKRKSVELATGRKAPPDDKVPEVQR
jgi:hypothetical protein